MLHYGRIETLKFANKTILCLLSATFMQKKSMRLLGIARSTDEIEQYGKRSSLTFRLPCDRIEKIIKFANKTFVCFLSATLLQKKNMGFYAYHVPR